MRGTCRGLWLLVLLASCNRSEEAKPLRDGRALAPSSNRASDTVASSPGAPSASETGNKHVAAADPATAPSAAAACVVPSTDIPAAPALPAKTCPKPERVAPVLSRASLRFPDAPRAPRLSVEVAKSASEHAHGLMYRTQMPEDHGMIFEWPTEARRVFWMHNTCLPLDMLFIARDMTIAGILEQVPVLNDEPRTVPCPAAYVLEVNAGWTRRHGIKPGMRILLE